MGARSTTGAAAMVWVMVLAGCLGADDRAPSSSTSAAPAAAEDPGSAMAGVAGPDTDAGTAFITEDAPFSLDGETAASVGACGFPAPAPPCFQETLDEGSYVLDIPHASTVTRLALTLTFVPTPPFIEELYFMIHVDDGTRFPMIASGQGPTGTHMEVADIDVNATARIVFFTWPAADADVLGPVWVDPQPHDFHIEGTVTELSAG